MQVWFITFYHNKNELSVVSLQFMARTESSF